MVNATDFITSEVRFPYLLTILTDRNPVSSTDICEGFLVDHNTTQVLTWRDKKPMLPSRISLHFAMDSLWGPHLYWVRFPKCPTSKYHKHEIKAPSRTPGGTETTTLCVQDAC